MRVNGLATREQGGAPNWSPRYWVTAGLFLAMAFILVLPTGAGSGTILLICSTVYLLRHGSDVTADAGHSALEKWFLASLALYPAVVALNLLLDTQPHSAGWERFDNPSRFLFALLIYWALRKSEVTSVGLVTGSIAGAIGAGSLAIFQWLVLGDSRPSGFANAIPFGDIALVLVFMAAAPARLLRTWRLLRPVGIGLGLGAVVLAQTRGAWVAIPFLAWISMEWFPGRRSDLLRGCILGILVSVAGLFLFVLLSGKFTVISAFLHEVFPEMRVSSLLIRLETWKAAWVLICDHPWFGVGIGQYGQSAQPLLESAGLSDTGLRSATAHAHNDFLYLGATMGIFAILAYLVPLLLLYLVGRHFCHRNCLTMGVLLKLFAAGQGIFSLTQTQLSHNLSATFFAMAAVSLVALGFNELQSRHSTPDLIAGESYDVRAPKNEGKSVPP